MASVGQAVLEEVISLAGGVNNASAPSQLKEDECLGLNNIVLDEAGGGAKRLGCTTISDPGGEIISMTVFYRGMAATPQVVVETDEAKVRYSTNGGVSWTDIVTAVDLTWPMCFEIFNDKLYMSNGVDSYMTWDGSTVTALPSAPKGRFLKVFKDTMWVAGTDDDRVWSSDPGNGDVFTVGNWVDLGEGDGDTMQGLATDGNVLICCKRRRGFLIYDPTTFANRMYDPDKGAESHFAFVHYGEKLYYLTRLGIVIFLGDSPSQIISNNIAPVFQADVLNFSTMHLAWAYTHNNRIGWTVPEISGGRPSMQIELLPGAQKQPFTFHRMPVRCFSTYRVGTTEQLLAGKVNDSKLVEAFDGGTDDGVPFSGTIETRWFKGQDSMKFKYLRRLLLIGRGIFYVGVLRNFESGVMKTIPIDLTGYTGTWDAPGDVWDDELWGPTLVLETIPIHPDVYGREFKFRMTDSSEDTGTQAVDIGDIDYAIVKGSWAFYGATLQEIMMGTDL